MLELIKSNHDLCTGCNRCVRGCPMELANTTFQNDDAGIKVSIDHEKCIACGRCLSVCKHEARYFEDDTARFFEDLSNGVSISLVAAPAIRTNIPEYKRLFTFLKNAGVKKIYDVSLGADICTWAHIRYIEKNGTAPLITQPCPVIVSYCELYRHELLDKLSPIHSPACCAASYIIEYEGITDQIAALTPCIAKSNEFEETGLVQYNVTFDKLQKYLDENNIVLPEEESEFDDDENRLGSIYPMPGGLRENIEYYLGRKLRVSESEGTDIFNRLDTYSETPEKLLPDIFDVLSCSEGCNIGSAVSCELNVFEIESTMRDRMSAAEDENNREYLNNLHELYDKKLELSHFLRTYRAIETSHPLITEQDIEKAFELLGKTSYEKQHVDCSACGSMTCGDMARKIALGVNIPSNCMVHTMETAKEEHELNLAAQEQLLMAKETREADTRMQAMINANPHINILFNERFEVIDCNPAAISFMGFNTKDEMIEGFIKRITESIPPKQSNGRPSVPLPERFKTVMAEGSVKFETDIILGGDMRTLDVNFIRIPYEGGIAIVGYVYDMTELHQREMELQQARQLNDLQLDQLNMAVSDLKTAQKTVATMFESNPHINILFDSELKVIDCNPAAVKFMRFETKDEMLAGFAERLATSIPPVTSTGRETTPISEIFMAAVKDGFIKLETEFILGGERHSVDVELRRIPYADSFAIVGYLFDTTTIREREMELKRRDEQLSEAVKEAEAANKAKSAFLSTMSHEIRTPMNAILGITEIQLQNESLDQDVREALGKIYTSGDMLLGIINDILDLSKIEAGKLELVISKYEIASLISDTAQLNMMRIGSKPIEFELYVDANIPAVLSGDELRVKQILNNILSNAFKYTIAGSVNLSISAESKAGNDSEVNLVIVVADTGQGMTKQQVEQLFDEYSRFNMEANRTTEGTGLGMNITRNLVRLMGGEIIVDSEPGKGSKFTVRLPQGRDSAEVLGSELASNLRNFRTRSRTQMKRVQITREPMPYGSVLVVDDVETNIYVAKGLLTPYGLKIDSAESGFEAIEKIKNGRMYDIIFMDHMMPKMDGIETTKNIRNMGYEPPIVALTANAVTGQADIFLGNGFDDYISKPIDVRQLNTVLNRLIRDKQTPEVLEEARRQTKSDTDGEAVSIVDPKFAEVFVRDALKSIAALDSILGKNSEYSDDDLRTFVIHVHGMKSALANIGNMELSAVALKLETSGRDGDVGVISSETPEFLDSLRALTERLKPKDDEEGAVAEDEDASDLREKLLEVKSACEAYNKKVARDLIKGLRDRTWSRPVKELLETIAESLLHSEFDAIADAVEDYLQK